MIDCKEEYIGACFYCGQTQTVTVSEIEELKLGKHPEQIANAKATEGCACYEARKWRHQQRVTDFKAMIGSDAINFMTQFKIDKLAIQDEEGRKAKLTRKTTGNIDVEITCKEIY